MDPSGPAQMLMCFIPRYHLNVLVWWSCNRHHVGSREYTFGLRPDIVLRVSRTIIVQPVIAYTCIDLQLDTIIRERKLMIVMTKTFCRLLLRQRQGRSCMLHLPTNSPGQ